MVRTRPLGIRHILIALAAGAALTLVLFTAATGGYEQIQRRRQLVTKPPPATLVPPTATLVPSCVPPGSRVLLHLSGYPGVTVAYAVAYSDGQFQKSGPNQRLDDSGKLTLQWRVPDRAAQGVARVLVATSDGSDAKQIQKDLLINPTCPALAE